MSQVRFSVPGPPVGKGRPRVVNRNGHSQAFTPKKTVIYENQVRIEYETQTKRFRFADDDMLDMRIVAFYQIPKSASKKKKSLMLTGMIRPTKKPDMDNVMKIIADSLNGIAYRDDTQIVDAQCRKFYAEEPRVDVKIRKVGMTR